MEKSCTEVVQDGNTELRAVDSTRVTQGIAGAESTDIAEEQDNKSRELNLVIVGIPYYKNEETSKVVFGYVLETMQVVPKATFRAFRLGRGSSHGPAPMMVQFQDVSHSRALESRRLVMHNKYKMKGTPIKIFPDLTPSQRQALPLEKQKVQKAREQGLWCELREGVATHPVPMRNRGHTNMVKSKQAKDLPEHLVETIIAMMPFPFIFKAKCLCRSWLVRFSPITSLDDETDKRLAISFQKLVGESSGNWNTFWPYIFHVSVGNERSFAYDRAWQKWQKLPSVSFLPKNVIKLINERWYDLEMDGALLYGCHRSETGLQLLVANLLTRRWKLLPPILDSDADSIIWKKLVCHSLSEYKMMVLLGYRSSAVEEFTDLRIYDSNSGSWASKKFVVEQDEIFIGRYRKKYLNGVLYMAASNTVPPKCLLALDLQEGTLEKIPIIRTSQCEASFWPTGDTDDYDWDPQPVYKAFDLVVCNGNLLMIAKGKEFYFKNDYNFCRDYFHYLCVFKIDLVSRSLTSLGCSPHFFDNSEWECKAAVSDGQSIFFKRDDAQWGLEYNVGEDQWKQFAVTTFRTRFQTSSNWSKFSFQPGLNPFTSV